MSEWILNNLLLTSAGAGALIFILVRIIPNEKILASGIWIGTFITAKGTQLLGEKFWERIEKEFISWGGIFFKGIVKGLESDDKQNGG